MLNKYGRDLTGIKQTASEMHPINDNRYHWDLMYDKAVDKVWCDFMADNSWKQYDSDSIIHVCSTKTHMTMQQIADAVEYRLTMYY